MGVSMKNSTTMHFQEWGKGSPVIALHGLGLESTSFGGLGRSLAGHGLRFLAADLPGFGQTPAPGGPLTPAVLAEPVLELARTLEQPPLVMGMSLGGRVALEAALQQPSLFRGVVMIAPALPRQDKRWSLNFARLLSPGIAKRIPIELAWPYLKKLADRLEEEVETEHDWTARASKRAIYYISCPATRAAFISAARELALDPAFGPNGVWTRLAQLKLPTAFVWGGEDNVLPKENAQHAADTLPSAFQVHIACAGHHDNGPHFHCLEQAAVEAVGLVEAVAHGPTRPPGERPPARFVECCAPYDNYQRAMA